MNYLIKEDAKIVYFRYNPGNNVFNTIASKSATVGQNWSGTKGTINGITYVLQQGNFAGGANYAGIDINFLYPISSYSNTVNGLASDMEYQMQNIVGRAQTNPNINPPVAPIPPPPGPNAGSFATQSIDNVHDLLNFCKGAGVVLLAASTGGAASFAIANIIVCTSFVYAVRNQILKFTIKFIIHGHK